MCSLINGSGACSSDREVLARKIGKGFNATVLRHNNLVGVIIKAGKNADVRVGIAFKGVRTHHGLIHQVCVGNADLSFAVFGLVQVVHTASGWRCNCVHACNVVIPELYNLYADGIKRAGRAGSDKVDIRCQSRCGKRCRQNNDAENQCDPLFHRGFPHFLLLVNDLLTQRREGASSVV